MILRLQGGSIEPLDPPQILFSDPAVQYGALGFFETMRAERGRVHLFAAHMERLRRALARWRIREPDPDLLAGAIRRAAAAFEPDAPLRIRVTAGPEPGESMDGAGLWPCRVFIEAGPLAAAHQGPIPRRPAVRVMLVRDLPIEPGHALAGHKHSHYYLHWEARRRARAQGYGEAAMVNTRGELAEASAHNLFWIAGGRIYTPAPECGGLPGVFAAFVAKLAQREGFGSVERVRARPEDLARVSGVFLTNSLTEIAAVSALDVRSFEPLSKDHVARALIYAVENSVDERADFRLAP